MRHIELNLQNIGQLFTTTDSSSFRGESLDQDAQDFIIGSALEFSRREPFDLIIRLETMSEGEGVRPLVQSSVRGYFAVRTKLNKLEFNLLMKEGRWSLSVGLSFLVICLSISHALARNIAAMPPGFAEQVLNILEQGLTIAGWVALWRPMEIYLYEWWPLRQRGKILQKLSVVDVQIQSTQ